MHRFTRKAVSATGALAVISLLAVASAFARADAPASVTAPNVSCANASIGFQGPITGDAAFIGKEQLGFARYAIRKLAGGKIKLVEEDTQLDPAQASTTGTRLHANANVLAVVGPAGSQEVLAVAPIYRRGQPDAVHLRLGDGHGADERLDPELLPGRAERQRPVARRSRTSSGTILKAKDVFIVDDQTAYSRPLANGVQSNLRAGGVKVDAQVGQPGRDRLLVARLDGRRRDRRGLPALADGRERRRSSASS